MGSPVLEKNGFIIKCCECDSESVDFTYNDGAVLFVCSNCGHQGFNNFENDTQPKIPNEYLPPKELMNFVCSRPSLHLLPELIKMTMAMKDNSYQLVELTSDWSNNFGNVLQTGIPKHFTFKEKTLLEELELTEGDLNNADIKKVVTDLENWENKETYTEALRITKKLAKLYKER